MSFLESTAFFLKFIYSYLVIINMIPVCMYTLLRKSNEMKKANLMEGVNIIIQRARLS